MQNDQNYNDYHRLKKNISIKIKPKINSQPYKIMIFTLVFFIMACGMLTIIQACFSTETDTTKSRRIELSKANNVKSVSSNGVSIDTERFKEIDTVINKAINDDVFPGCVLLIAKDRHVIKFSAYGNRRLVPDRQPTELDTIYDIASLTKPVATATSIMILVEEGKLRLNDRVSSYIPGFTGTLKDEVTISHLLTHTSGLISFRPYKSLIGRSNNPRAAVIDNICSESLRFLPGEDFTYSDLNYILLEQIIYQITNQRINTFARERIFNPLQMSNSMFIVPEQLKNQCAANLHGTSIVIQGEVHDPTASYLRGISGNAGLFSTAEDLAKFCQMMLNGGTYDGQRILSEASVCIMTTNQITVPDQRRGFGWDIETGYSYPKGDLASFSSYGHTGYTGTSIWIDPEKNFFIVFLSNRILSQNHTRNKPVISAITNIVCASIID